MFICSVRSSTVKFFAIIVLAIAILGACLLFGTGAEVTAAILDVRLDGMKTNEDRLEFISQFGIEVAGEARESEKFAIPENFDRVLSAYNEIQKEQGFDLTKYKNKKVTRYTYSVKGYEGYEGDVNVNLIIYRDTVIGCDISSVDPNGFVKPLIKI